jgi:diadenosine tetraphosphate (Ap4A) HIT family hydrolase
MRPSVPYDVFEGRKVLDHLMVIPRRHVESIADFTPEEMLDTMHVIAEYERQGYNAYIRGVGSVRSVRHQHTHLIKIQNEKMKFVLFLRWPYLVIKL